MVTVGQKLVASKEACGIKVHYVQHFLAEAG
jgi:hypothetical protein